MTDLFALVFDVRTRIINRHYAFELRFGDGAITLYALADTARTFTPAALLTEEEPGQTTAFLDCVARELGIPEPRPGRAIRRTPTEVALVFRGAHFDSEEQEWLSYTLGFGENAEANLRICPSRRVAYLEEKSPPARLEFFTALKNALLEPDSPADWSVERPTYPDFDWLVDDVPLAFDVVPKPISIRPPHVRWVGAYLVGIEANSRRVMMIEPKLEVLFEADYIYAIRVIDETTFLVHFRTGDMERYATVSVRDGVEEISERPPEHRGSWLDDVHVEESADGLRVRSGKQQVTYGGLRGVWRAVSPRYIVSRLDAYYLLDGFERRGWVITPGSRWAAFEVDDGASRLAFATFGGRLFTAKPDQRHEDGAVPTNSRSKMVEGFWQGVDADYVTVGGIHTDLSVTCLAREYAMDPKALSKRLETRLTQFMSLYLPRVWSPDAVARARFDLAPAWAEALRRGASVGAVQAAAERLAFALLRRRLFDSSFIDLLVRGGRPIQVEDFQAFDTCVSSASTSFLESALTDEEIATQVQLHLRQASDSLRFLAEENIEVEPDKWATVRWRMDRFGQLSRMNVSPIVGQHELLNLAREVEALA